MSALPAPFAPDAVQKSRDRFAGFARFTVLEELTPRHKTRRFLAQEETPAGARRVRLHVLLADGSDEPGELLAFLLEAHAAARLAHRNILATAKPERFQALHFFVSEQPQSGETLGARLDREGWLAIEEALAIAAQLAAALDHAHQSEVLHLQLEPEQVWLEEDGTARLCGFGIPKMPSREWAHRKRSEAGAFAYRSPEQLADENLCESSDLYALGVLLYEMLTDVLPFHSRDAVELRQKIAMQKSPPVSLIRPEVPETLSLLVATLLARDPQMRPTSAAALRAALKEEADNLYATAATATEEVGEAPLPTDTPAAPALPALDDAAVEDAAVAGLADAEDEPLSHLFDEVIAARETAGFAADADATTAGESATAEPAAPPLLPVVADTRANTWANPQARNDHAAVVETLPVAHASRARLLTIAALLLVSLCVVAFAGQLGELLDSSSAAPEAIESAPTVDGEERHAAPLSSEAATPEETTAPASPTSTTTEATTPAAAGVVEGDLPAYDTPPASLPVAPVVAPEVTRLLEELREQRRSRAAQVGKRQTGRRKTAVSKASRTAKKATSRKRDSRRRYR